jgi:leader peptidase (prepilin peptidase) / N-methyltransferase
VSAFHLFGLVLLGILSAIAWIDFRYLIIPDRLVLSLAAFGIAHQAITSMAGLPMQLAAGALLFSLFWGVRRVHARISGRVGLGFGDVKMVGACAVWLHPLNLPFFIVIACLFALLYAIGWALLRGSAVVGVRQPFGPFLGFGLFLTWIGEQQMLLEF